MIKVKEYLIIAVVLMKSTLLIGLILSIVLIGSEQLHYCTSGFPEHIDFTKKNSGKILGLLLFAVPLTASIFVDIIERKKGYLGNMWYVVTVILIAGYVLMNIFQRDALSYFIALCLTFIFVPIVVYSRNRSTKRNY